MPITQRLPQRLKYLRFVFPLLHRRMSLKQLLKQPRRQTRHLRRQSLPAAAKTSPPVAARTSPPVAARTSPSAAARTSPPAANQVRPMLNAANLLAITGVVNQ